MQRRRNAIDLAEAKLAKQVTDSKNQNPWTLGRADRAKRTTSEDPAFAFSLSHFSELITAFRHVGPELQQLCLRAQSPLFEPTLKRRKVKADQNHEDGRVGPRSHQGSQVLSGACTEGFASTSALTWQKRARRVAVYDTVTKPAMQHGVSAAKKPRSTAVII